MKTRIYVALIVIVIGVAVWGMLVKAEDVQELNFEKFYITLPAINLRAAPDVPGAIDCLTAGTKVELISIEDTWTKIRYEKDGKEFEAWTWTGSVAPAIRIHLLEDEFIYHKPGSTQEDLGMISSWRELDLCQVFRHIFLRNF